MILLKRQLAHQIPADLDITTRIFSKHSSQPINQRREGDPDASSSHFFKHGALIVDNPFVTLLQHSSLHSIVVHLDIPQQRLLKHMEVQQKSL